MLYLLALFGAVVLLNIMPAFAPPTWMLLSFFGLRFPDANPWIVALLAASAATCGRCMLAAFAQRLNRSRRTKQSNHRPRPGDAHRMWSTSVAHDAK